MAITPSKGNNFNMHDMLNTLMHIFFVLISGVLADVLKAVNEGTGLDFEYLKKVAVVSIITGLMVFVKRYLQDNTTTETTSVTVETPKNPEVKPDKMPEVKIDLVSPGGAENSTAVVDKKEDGNVGSDGQV